MFTTTSSMDGITVLKRLREWSRVPVIVLTVREREEDKIAALDNGADDYVTKPFNTGELRRPPDRQTGNSQDPRQGRSLSSRCGQKRNRRRARIQFASVARLLESG